MIWTVMAQDVRFQWRHGFYAVYAVVSLVYVGILTWLPPPFRGVAAQVIIFSDPAVLGFLFSAGMVLLEKSQGVLAPLFVSPLSLHSWLAGRALSLSLLSAASGLSVAMGGLGADLRWYGVLLALVPGSVCFTFLGLGLAARVETVNEFLIKSQFLLIPMALPLLELVDGETASWLWWMPGHAVLGLLHAALVGRWAEAPELAGLLLIWCLLAYGWAHRSFTRHILERIGGGGR